MAASTRVPVRGKRKQPPAPSSSPAQPPATRQRRSLATVLARRRRRPPPLEALPAELLEAVLLLSRSVALPRASLVIGLKLSPLLTRLRFFVEAFADTWLDNRGLVVVPCLGDPLLQTALLQLPWVTIDFILRARQLWADRLPSAALDVRAIFDRDYAAATTTTTTTSSSSPLIPLLTSTTRDVHPDVRLPSDLLVGPWNHEQLRRLFWLMRAGLPRHPDAWTRHLPWELKLRCLQNALLDPVPPPVFVVYYLVHDTLFLSIPRPALAALLSRILALPKPALDPDRDTIIRHRIKPVLRHMAIFNPNTP